ncbi:hibA, partial [Symbiodinium sp. KB8]
SCVPCWLFFLLGWLFTLLFMREVMTQGTDIFSFEDPAVETDLKAIFPLRGLRLKQRHCRPAPPKGPSLWRTARLDGNA